MYNVISYRSAKVLRVKGSEAKLELAIACKSQDKRILERNFKSDFENLELKINSIGYTCICKERQVILHYL